MTPHTEPPVGELLSEVLGLADELVTARLARRDLRAVNSLRWCHAELKLSTGTVLARCELAKDHPDRHKDGPTRWA